MQWLRYRQDGTVVLELQLRLDGTLIYVLQCRLDGTVEIELQYRQDFNRYQSSTRAARSSQGSTADIQLATSLTH